MIDTYRRAKCKVILGPTGHVQDQCEAMCAMAYYVANTSRHVFMEHI